jgi:membrane protein DedA with SNARE-associated domain
MTDEVVAGAGIAVATLVSEDLSALAAGLLAGQNRITLTTAMVSASLGIYLGDLGLFAAGRLARRIPWLRSQLDAALRRGGDDLPRLGWRGVVLSRFLPGSRLPLYVAAGYAGTPPHAFAAWTAVATLLWTPLIVAGAAILGTSFAHLVERYVAVAPILVAAIAAGLIVRRRRHRGARPDRAASPWEFWPTWLLYLPLMPWLGWLIVRHGPAAVSAANPGMPGGGLVGESKHGIQQALPARWAVPSALIPPGDARQRWWWLRHACRRLDVGYPLVLKPDVGQRGAGVAIVHDDESARTCLRSMRDAVIVQPWHPGPFEAGLFYCRYPHETRGRLLSITRKVFPEVTGDGRSSIADLIVANRRYRRQLDVFRRRLGERLRVVPAAGERVPLGAIGNHSQGTLFLDGHDWWTPELEARVDEIARATPGFHIGRFDVRFHDLERFRAGDDLAIIELNGVSAEPTDLYDPRHRLVDALRILAMQWRLVFEIGSANRRRGAAGTPVAALLKSIWQHLWHGQPERA